MTPSSNRLTTTLILLIILGIVLHGLLTALAGLLPWLVLGLAAGVGGYLTARVILSRSKHF